MQNKSKFIVEIIVLNYFLSSVKRRIYSHVGRKKIAATIISTISSRESRFATCDKADDAIAFEVPKDDLLIKFTYL